MQFRLSRLPRLLTCLITVAMVATSCGLTSDSQPDAAQSPTPTAPGLLPPSPASDAATPTAAVPATQTPDAAVTAAEVVPLAEPSTLSCLTTRQRAAQLLLPLLTQPEIPGAQTYASVGDLGAIGLLQEPDEGLKDVIAALQASSQHLPVMVASDEEGGSVQRLAVLLGPLPSAEETARTKTPEQARNQWVEYGSRVRALGIDVVFGPVLDVGAAPGIKSRSFGDDPAVVTAYAGAMASGLLEAGIVPVFKHFPGHGRASADSHLELPTTPPLAELRTVDLVPYVDLFADPVFRDRAAVMIGHLAVPDLSDGTPTSLSPATVNGLLRGELGFAGLVFTDAINMGAIIDGYGRLDALELALRSGSDIVILGSLADLTPALDHLVMLAETDPGFAMIIDNRAARVVAAKGQDAYCAGAQ